ncbi:unnamed protein product [Symbiodinium natans]|uniref:BTB domain-containing protein n=1 Tax=Symbiodinium natans TaxID=878477 RepID=A0A812JZL4_9DINO|nr:unnamed protein product [Symbiodinium natans]
MGMQNPSKSNLDTYCKIIEWMLTSGADPWLTGPETTFTFPLQNYFNVPVSGHSAISLAVELLRLSQNPKVAQDMRSTYKQYLDRVLSLLAVKADNRKCTQVGSGVLQRWIQIRHLTDTHTITFEAADGAVTCHDSMLMATSPVLRAMIGSDMMERSRGTITLDKQSSASLSLLMDMLYTGSTCLDSDPKIVLEALELAHRWDVRDVVQALAGRLQDMISIESLVSITEASKRLGLEDLHRSCDAFAARVNVRWRCSYSLIAQETVSRP